MSGVLRMAGTNAPIPRAEIKVEGPGLAARENSQLIARSNADGRYQFEVPAGPYDIWMVARDFEELKLHLVLRPGEGIQRDFELQPVVTSYAYRVEDVELPQQMVPEISGVAFTPAGSLVVCNRRGEVWIRAIQNGRWRRFASGLYEGFGLVAPGENEIMVLQRPELTRLVDTDGNGEADRYETIADDWGITGNYHEFSYGLARDRAGNFYGSLGMASTGEFPWVRGPVKRALTVPMPDGSAPRDPHSSVALYQGWAFRVDRDGTFVPLATGLRQPLGVGVSPQDELFITDVSGAWVPTSVLLHIEPGSFYGHPDGLKWHPDYREQKLAPADLAKMRRPPTVYLPRGLMGTSPGQPVWDTTGGKFGPYEGQMFVGDVSSLLMRVDLERVDGGYQGAAFPFIRGQGLRLGGMHHAFGPDGALYVGQTVRGWMPGENSEGLQRVAWTGVTPVDIHRLRLTRTGFALHFTEAMTTVAGEARSYRMRRFRYHYHIHDGSLRVNEVDVPITAVRQVDDGRTTEIDLLELQSDYVYELQLNGQLMSAAGRPLLNPVAYYTANRLLPGTVVKPTMLMSEAEKPLEPGRPERGEPVFRLYCMACHQPDGKGSKVVGTPDYTAADGPLRRPDAELLAVIMNGKQQMPAFGNVLPAQSIHDVLSYLRKTFGSQVESP
ncbi:MAG: c-type cytochrome [Opitutaceae bacterium]|nr:c-type cytochrome [Opitutaceae bacterium]